MLIIRLSLGMLVGALLTVTLGWLGLILSDHGGPDAMMWGLPLIVSTGLSAWLAIVKRRVTWAIAIFVGFGAGLCIGLLFFDALARGLH